ncbi:hypothetical protein JXA80_11725 [bacterium]|nr:hypothetical protein [candidate division CSSED10-310 bacterium]
MKKVCVCVVCVMGMTIWGGLAAPVLLIPDSTSDTVGKYDPQTGVYLGDLITGYSGFSTPINAIQGPDGNIYVSDQVADAVFVFDVNGTYLQTYADATDGLNNIRGIDFFGTKLYVTSGDGFVAVFSGPHVRDPDFINDGSDPFDIYFVDDGSALVADIVGTTDNVRYYLPDGTFSHIIFSVNFPEQIQKLPDGSFINASFSAGVISNFDLTALMTQVPFASGRGVFRLGNGNLIATNGDGVFELDFVTGAQISTLRSGVSARFIEVVDLPSEPTPTPVNTATPTPVNTATPTPSQTPLCNHDGDVTLDNEITAGDAQLAFLVALGSYTPNFEEACAADCNGDEAVTAGDAQLIFLTVLGSGACVDPMI